MLTCLPWILSKMFASAHFNVANLLRAASKFVRLLRCTFYFLNTQGVLYNNASFKLKSWFRMSNVNQSGYVQCTFAFLAQCTCHVPSFAFKALPMHVRFRTTVHVHFIAWMRGVLLSCLILEALNNLEWALVTISAAMHLHMFCQNIHIQLRTFTFSTAL